MAIPTAFSAEYSGVSMAATRAMIRKGVKDLHLVAVPSTSLQADLLIGAGCVASLPTGSILLYEYGRANRFIAAQKAGAITVKDSTCPAIHAGLIAGEKGLPFMPVRGLIGSDILQHRMQSDGWLSIDNPFAEDDPIVLVPPLRPDVTILHVPLADRFGNVWIGRRSEFATMARASAKTPGDLRGTLCGGPHGRPRQGPGDDPGVSRDGIVPPAERGLAVAWGGTRTRRMRHICASTPSARKPPADSPSTWMPTSSMWT